MIKYIRKMKSILFPSATQTWKRLLRERSWLVSNFRICVTEAPFGELSRTKHQGAGTRSSLNPGLHSQNSRFKTLNPKPRTSSSFFNDPRSVFPFLLCIILLFFFPVYSQAENFGIKYPEIKTLILENRFDAAQKLLDASAGTETGSASLELYQTEIWIGRANSLYESGKKKSAFEYYELAYQKWPNHPTVYQRYNELRGRSLSDLSVRNTAGHYGAGNAVSISEKAYDRRNADSAVQPERRTEKEDTFLFAGLLVLSALVLSLLATNISLLIILARQGKK